MPPKPTKRLNIIDMRAVDTRKRDRFGRFVSTGEPECWCEIYGLVIIFCLFCIVALQYTDKHMNEIVSWLVNRLMP